MMSQRNTAYCCSGLRRSGHSGWSQIVLYLEPEEQLMADRSTSYQGGECTLD
jgi:hypothetical protein